MTSTALVPYDRAFATSMLRTQPVFHAQVHDHLLPTVEPEPDVDWRFYDPSVVDLEHLEGLDYWDQLRLRHPEQVDTAKFLDNYELDHVSETGRQPRAQWYRDARQRQRARYADTRRKRLTREWAANLTQGVFSLGDGDDSYCSGTEEFSDSFRSEGKLRVKTWTSPSGHTHSVATCFDKAGNFLPAGELIRSRQTAERYRDTSVAETAIFHPVKGDGLTLDEMLSDMRRFVIVSGDAEWEPDPVEFPLTHAETIDRRYVEPDDAKRRIRKAKQVVELADLRARAVEICRFPWNDDRAKQHDSMARGWVRRSRLLEWGSDTWQVILTRRCVPVDHDVDHPRARNFWTVFVRTHTGSETVRRAGRADLQVWTWEPHYYAVFADEEQATQYLERLEAAFLRERHGDLDQERWPNDLVNDRSVAAAQAAAQWKLWQARNRDGWQRINLDGHSAPGALTFEPEQPQTWDPSALQQRLDAEYADYDAAQ